MGKAVPQMDSVLAHLLRDEGCSRTAQRACIAPHRPTPAHLAAHCAALPFTPVGPKTLGPSATSPAASLSQVCGQQI